MTQINGSLSYDERQVVEAVLHDDLGDGRCLADFARIDCYRKFIPVPGTIADYSVIQISFGDYLIAWVAIGGRRGGELRRATITDEMFDILTSRSLGPYYRTFYISQSTSSTVKIKSSDKWVRSAGEWLIPPQHREKTLGDMLEQRHADRAGGRSKWKINLDTIEEFAYLAVRRPASLKYIRTAVAFAKNLAEWIVKLSRG